MSAKADSNLDTQNDSQSRCNECHLLFERNWDELDKQTKTLESLSVPFTNINQCSTKKKHLNSSLNMDSLQYLYLLPKTPEGQIMLLTCPQHTVYRIGHLNRCSKHPSIGEQTTQFPRKCYSLPRCYKPWKPLNGNYLQDDYNATSCDNFDNENYRRSCPTLAVPSCFDNVPRGKYKMTAAEFKGKLDIMKQWFSEFSDQQKNFVLKTLLNQCSATQNHLLSVVMAPIMHQHCPNNCEDPISSLPDLIATRIFSYLDPGYSFWAFEFQSFPRIQLYFFNLVSLCRCTMVCRAWQEMAGDPFLWHKFCQSPQWQLSRAAEQKQMIMFRLPHGGVDWKQAFAERFRLQRNWIKGNCHVRTFHGHIQGVFCVQFDDTRIVSGSSDKTIKVWNIRTNSPWLVMTLVGHSGTVRCLHLEGNRLVSGSSDCTIKVWDLSTQHSWSSIACKVTMIGHSDTVRCLQVDEDKVVSGSYDYTLKVWNVKTGACRMTLRGHEGAVLCLQFDDNKIVSGSGDKTIKIWKLIDGECLMSLEGHQDAVTCLQFDNSKIISGSLDRTIKFWSLATGGCLSTLDWMKSEGHTGVVRCLQSDHWRIVSGGDDKTLKVWSLESGQRLVTLRNHTDGVTCLQFNDSVIVSGSYDQTVKLWDFSVC